MAEITCTICREESACDFETHCGHIFHEECLKTWLESTQLAFACPFCRTLITDSKSAEKLLKEVKKGNFSVLDELEPKDIVPLLKITILDDKLPYKITFETCLAKNWKVNDNFDDHYTCAVHLVAASGRVDLLEYLLTLNVDLDVVDELIGSPLHYAVENEDMEMTKALINNGHKVNLCGYHYQTPIYFAIRNHNFELIKLLLENRAGLGSHQYACLTTVEMAIATEAGFDIVEFLIENGAEDSADDCFLSACKYGILEYIKHYVEKGADIYSRSNRGYNALQLAAGSDDVEALEYVLALCSDTDRLNTDLNTPLMAAAENGALSTLIMLIDRGDDLNTIRLDHTAIQVACFNENFEAADILFDAGADIFIKTNHQQLMFARLLKNPELLEKFLEKDYDKEAPILHAVCGSNNYDLLVKYIDKGYDVNGLNYLGETPLFYARDTQIIEKLLEGTFDVELQDFDGMTPFLWACISGNKILFEALLEVPNCNIHRVTSKNQNALHLSCLQGELGFLSPLIKRGVDVNLVDSDGFNPIAYVLKEFFEYKRFVEGSESMVLALIEEMREAGAVLLPPEKVSDFYMKYYESLPVVRAYVKAYEEQCNDNKGL